MTRSQHWVGWDDSRSLRGALSLGETEHWRKLHCVARAQAVVPMERF